LKVGSKGTDVKKLQQNLKDLGYNISVDGVYGKDTKAIVEKFQKEHGLATDGVAGKNTWEAIAEEKKNINNAPKNTNKLLKVGSKGENVKKLQQDLKDLGYDISVDGVYGGGTKAIVEKFQKEHGLSIDGVVGTDTSQVIEETKRRWDKIKELDEQEVWENVNVEDKTGDVWNGGAGVTVTAPLFNKRHGYGVYVEMTGTRTYNVKESTNGYTVGITSNGISISDPNGTSIGVGTEKSYTVAAKIAQANGLTVKDGTKINMDSSVGLDGLKVSITAENKEINGTHTVDKLEFKPGVDKKQLTTATAAVAVAAVAGALTEGIGAEEAYVFTQTILEEAF